MSAYSLNVGSMHPPQTHGKVQSAVRLALSGMYLLQASALTGLIDCQITSKGPAARTPDCLRTQPVTFVELTKLVRWAQSRADKASNWSRPTWLERKAELMCSTMRLRRDRTPCAEDGGAAFGEPKSQTS